MELKQHFYASIPAEAALTGRRGLQTVATSTGAGNETELEAHCRYVRPDGRREGAMPANWGWFHLADGRACVHRIGYSGTDELGRPGNFMAHNLIVEKVDLLSISYDITSLIRWARDVAEQFTTKSGNSSGFARRHDQIYQKYSGNTQALRKLPPLCVTSTEIKAIRDQTDRSFEKRTLALASQRLGDEGVARLLEAVLSETAERRSILVMGLSDGDDDSAAEFELVELLFTLLPLHCRMNLTFSTYHEDPLEVTKANTVHNKIRLVMSPKTENAKFCVELPQLRVFDLSSGGWPERHVLVPIAKRYSQAVLGHNLVGLLTLRDYVNQFVFDDDLQGLADGSRLMELQNGKKPELKDYDLFHRAAACVRPNASQFLDIARLLVTYIRSHGVVETSIIEQFAEDYFRVVQTLSPTLQQERGDQVANWQDIVNDMVQLFQYCIDRDSVMVLRISFESAISNVRGHAILQMANAFERSITLDDQSQLASLWDRLCVVCPRDQSDGEDFLARAATHLCNLVLRQFEAQRGAVNVSEEALPLIRDAPLAQPDQLLQRLTLLTHSCRSLSAGRASRECGKFLSGLIAGGQLKPELLQTIIENRRDVLLRFYNEWYAAADESSAIRDVLKPVLKDPGLLCAYWQVDVHDHDGALQRGLESAVGRLGNGPESAFWMPALVQPYVSEGSICLLKHFDGIPGQRLIGRLAEMVSAQCALMNLLIKRSQNDPSVANDVVAAVQCQLDGLLSEVCLSKKVGSDAEWGKFLIPVMKLILELSPFPLSRTEHFVRAAQRCIDRCKEHDVAIIDVRFPSLNILEENLGLLKVDQIEAHWYALCLRSARSGKGADAKQSDLLAALVLEYPEFASGDAPATEFTKFITSLLKAAKTRVWHATALRIVAQVSSRAGRDVLRDCFAHDGRYQSIISVFRNEKLNDGTLLDAFASNLTDKMGKLKSPIIELAVLLRIDDLPYAVSFKAKLKLAQIVMSELEPLLGKDNLARDDAYKAMAEICPALEFVGGSIDLEIQRRLWGKLSRALPDLSANEMRPHFGSVLDLAERIGLWDRQDVVLAWTEFFDPIHIHQKLFFQWLVLAGDTFKVHKNRGNRGRAHRLLDLRKRNSEWFQLVPGKRQKQLGWAVRLLPMMNKKNTNGSEDTFATELGNAPPDCMANADDRIAFEAISSRAVFAAYAYGDNLPRLVEIFCRLGLVKTRINNHVGPSWTPRNTAIAIAAYAVRESLSDLAKGGSIDDLTRSRPMRAFREFLRTHELDDKQLLIELCNEYERWLHLHKVREQDAVESANFLRKRFKLRKSRRRTKQSKPKGA